MSKNDKKLVLLVGILAAGIFTAAFASTQFLSATAQSMNNTSTGTVTGLDDPIPVDIGCPTGAEVCEDDYSHSVYSTVSTSGTATTRVQPDKFSVTVGVETDGTTAQEAADKNSELIAKVIAALRDLGIADADISTSSYSVYPVYGSRPAADACIMIYPTPPECLPGTEITGYRASNTVTVTLDTDGDIEVGQVIDTAIEAGANTVQGAYFFLSQERQMEVQEGLISQAIENARQRAVVAAGAVGMGVDRVKSISLNDVYFPVFARDISVAQEGGTQILPGQQEVTMTVNVVYIIAGGSDSGGSTNSGSESRDDMTIARNFILSKLPGLGIEIDDELDLHTDMVVHISETEFHLDFGVVDTDGGVHDGHIELVNGEVTVATLDGESIL